MRKVPGSGTATGSLPLVGFGTGSEIGIVGDVIGRARPEVGWTLALRTPPHWASVVPAGGVTPSSRLSELISAPVIAAVKVVAGLKSAAEIA